MADRPSFEEVKPRNLEGLGADCAVRPENGTDLRDFRLEGAVCAFELVRGRGDAEIARLAELQHGHVHLQQLRAAGIGRNAVARRVRTGRLHATLPCIYLVGRPRRDVFGRMMAAALYFKGNGLVSRRAAAHAWGLLDTTAAVADDDQIDVLLPATRGAGWVEGVNIHRTKCLSGKDVRWCNNLPVTSPARTLLDLAAVFDQLELEAALLIALRRNLVRESQLREVMARNPRAKGVGVLRELLEQRQSLHDTRSIYERKLLRLLRQAQLPLPVTNLRVGGKLVDAVWPDLRLVLEFDSWKYHGGRSNFENDRLRDQHVTATGHHIMRITARQIDHTPYALVARIATTIANLARAPEIPY